MREEIEKLTKKFIDKEISKEYLDQDLLYLHFVMLSDIEEENKKYYKEAEQWNDDDYLCGYSDGCEKLLYELTQKLH